MFDILDELTAPSLPRRIINRPRYHPFSEKPVSLKKFFGPIQRSVSVGRDISIIANKNLLFQNRSKNYFYHKLLPLPSSISGADRRLWSPASRAVNIYGQQVTPTDVNTLKSEYGPNWEKIMNPPRKIDWRPKLSTQLKNAPWWYGFANADKVVICIKRKIRREVLNALGIAGKKGQRSPKFNQWSRVRC